jgi:type IV secretion system protein TrbL
MATGTSAGAVTATGTGAGSGTGAVVAGLEADLAAGWGSVAVLVKGRGVYLEVVSDVAGEGPAVAAADPLGTAGAAATAFPVAFAGGSAFAALAGAAAGGGTLAPAFAVVFAAAFAAVFTAAFTAVFAEAGFLAGAVFFVGNVLVFTGVSPGQGGGDCSQTPAVGWRLLSGQRSRRIKR